MQASDRIKAESGGFLFICLIMIAVSCNIQKEPVKIGFAGPLTGQKAMLGIYGRDGALLAVEEINNTGGIEGHPLELIVKDDRHDPAEALKADKELIAEGAAAIIGHLTSEITVSVLPFINTQNILMISPTNSSSELAGAEDQFFRIHPHHSKESQKKLADFMLNTEGVKQIAAIYDLSNKSYSESQYNSFKSAFEEIGGQIVVSRTFSSEGKKSMSDLISDISAYQPQGIYLVANSTDASMLIFHIRKLNLPREILCTGWVMTEEFLRHGGAAVEGIFLTTVFDENSRKKAFLEFKEKFKARFGKDPNMFAAYSYETVYALVTALRQNPNPSELKQTLLQIRKFKGLQSDFEFDKYGDVKREFFVSTVKNGTFVMIK